VGAPGRGLVIDLGSGERYASYIGGPRNRAQHAWEAWLAKQVQPQTIDVMPGGPRIKPYPHVTLDSATVLVTPHNLDWWEPFTPLADGRPRLRKHALLGAQWRGNTLALKLSAPGRPTNVSVFRGPDGVFLGEHPIRDGRSGFTLSLSGSLLARQIDRTVVEISEVSGSLTPLGRTTRGGFSQAASFSLGDDFIELATGRSSVVLSWKHGELVREGGTYAVRYVATAQMLPAFLHYDRRRWRVGVQRRLWAAGDRYGQVALFDHGGHLVCMFFAFRDRVAGWMPDGTTYGPMSLTGRTAPGDAAVRFGRALAAASGRP
jgi:hypothetical protein